MSEKKYDNINNPASENMVKAIDEKKDDYSNTLLPFFTKFLGGDEQIVSFLPEQQKRNIIKLGWQFILLILLIITAAVIFLVNIFNPWVFTITLVFAILFIYLLFYSLSLRVFHRYVKNSKIYTVQRLVVFFTGVLLITLAYTGLNSKSIRSQFKKDLYTKENINFLNNLERVNKSSSLTERLREYQQYNLINFWNIVDNKNYDSIRNQLSADVEESKTKIDIYLSKINSDFNKDSVSYTDKPVIYEKMSKDLTAGNYPFIEQKGEEVFELKGILFAPDYLGKIKILENYNDSLLEQQLLLYVNSNILETFKIDTLRTEFQKRVLNKMFKGFNSEAANSAINFPLIQDALQNWLNKLLIAEDQSLSFNQWVVTGLSFIKKDSNWILLLFIIGFFAQYCLSVYDKLKSTEESGYTEINDLYNKSQVKRFEEAKQNLANKVDILSNISHKDISISRFEDLKDVNSYKFYLTSGDLFFDKGEYEKALGYYIDGYKQFKEQIIFLDKTAKSFRELGNDDQYDFYRDKFNAERNRLSHEANLANDICIQNIELKNHPFYGNLVWRLDSKMNILLGKNGYGKSHLLSVLLSILQNDRKKTKELTPNESTETEVKVFITASKKQALSESQQKEIDNIGDASLKQERQNEMNVENHSIQYSYKGIESVIGKIPVLAIPDIRFINKSTSEVRSNSGVNFTEDSAYHFLYQEPYSAIIENSLYKFCQNFIENKNVSPISVKKIIEEIFYKLTGDILEIVKISSTDNAGFEILIKTEGSNIPLPIQKISQGTFSIISIVNIIYNYLKVRYKNVPEEELALQHAIVFIDELDAHLHPAWQQKIINILHSSFPNIQFIITAHSPLIVAGCKEDEVSVMRKTDDNFQLHHFTEDFIGYMPDELYKIIFEIETDDETFARYNAMIPFENQIQIQIGELEKLRENLNVIEEAKLSNLYDDLYYITKVRQRLSKKMDNERVKQENFNLKIEVTDLQKNT